MNEEEFIIPDRDDILVEKIMLAGKFAMAWLILTAIYSAYTGHIIMSGFDWVLVFLLMCIYCPFALSMLMSRWWE